MFWCNLHKFMKCPYCLVFTTNSGQDPQHLREKTLNGHIGRNILLYLPLTRYRKLERKLHILSSPSKWFVEKYQCYQGFNGIHYFKSFSKEIVDSSKKIHN